MHDVIERAVVVATERDRRAAASAVRAARAEPAVAERPAPPGEVAIRLARPQDVRALELLGHLDADRATAARLAGLAEAPWDGAVLVAEVEGEVLAALVPEDGTAVADPFRPTASLATLLRLRAEQLTGARSPRGLARGVAALRPRFH